MYSTVHFGMHISLVPDTIKQEAYYFDSRGIGTDGDGWNCWGEAVGTNGNDDKTRHFFAHFDTIGKAIDFALILAGSWDHLLVDIADDNGSNIIISAFNDWSEQYFVRDNITDLHQIAPF